MWEAIAGIFAAVSAYTLNSWLGKRKYLPTVAGWGPLAEEWLKSGAAWLVGAFIPLVHFWFGCAEAVVDMTMSKRGTWPALTSLAGHVVYGLTTWGVMWETQSLLLGIVAACGLHITWNYAILALASRR